MSKAVELRHISKRFGRLAANHDISLSVEAGTIHALVGENGAGKSTLMKILYGLYQPDSGTIHVHGEEARIRSPHVALRLGLGMVHQHFMLVRPLTVAENVVLGAEPRFGPLYLRRRAGHLVGEIAERFGLAVEPGARVDTLSVGEEQRVEILKALYRGASVLILDEPTAVLTPQEVDELFAVLRKLRESGTTVLFITHKLREVMEIADRVTVLRGGKVAGEHAIADTSVSQLAEQMVGRPVPIGRERRPGRMGEVRLEMRSLRVRDDRGLEAVRGVSLVVRGGEIVGVAGVEGNGQAEWIDALAGLRRPSGGFVALHGKPVTRARPAARIKSGLAHVPADRLRRGLVSEMNLAENAILGRQWEKRFGRGPFLSPNAVHAHTSSLLAEHDVRPGDTGAMARNLSGGNQQKLVVGRELSRNARVLLVAHPTRGVDLGAIEHIHARLLAERDRGRAILLFSSELSELLALSDRIVVLYEGRITHETPANRTNERSLGLYMTGQRSAAERAVSEEPLSPAGPNA